ncbi:MAG: hypothetical protein M1820_002207 [Bogoriella megaspora]|nr:MAG: hypothetical protein M1820_002207 [Bogoriella megaspora]
MAEDTSRKRHADSVSVPENEHPTSLDHDAKRLRLEAPSATSLHSSATQIQAKTQNDADANNPDPRITSPEIKQEPCEAPKPKTPKSKVEPYKLESESLPVLPTYSPSFKKAEEYGKVPIRRILDMLDSKYPDLEDTVDFRGRLKDALNLTYPDAKVIGLIGESGVGKSSFINSVFNSPDYATKSSVGKSTTYVPTEYRPALPDQQKPFVAEVCFHSEHTRKSNLETYFANYYNYYVEKSSENLTFDEQQDADTAFQVFRTLFSQEKPFKTDEDAEKWLKLAKSHDDLDKLNELWRYVRNLMNDPRIENGRIRLESGDMKQLSSVLRPYTRDPPKGTDTTAQRTLWPLVERIRIYSTNRVLEQGIVLVDLPGTTDNNQLRAKSAMDYAQECHVILLVANLGRITDDPFIKECLARYSRDNAVQENIDDAIEAMPELMQAQVQAYDANIDALKSEIDEIEATLEDADGDEGENSTLEKSKQAKLKSVEALAAKKTSFLVAARNDSIRQLMQEQYRSITGDKDCVLQVFCVSNTIYDLHMKGYARKRPPILTLEETGIPQVREFCYSLPSRTKFKTLEIWIRHTIPSHISAAKVLCTRTKIQRKEQLEELIHKPEQTYKRLIDEIHNAVRTQWDEEILDSLKRREHHWCAKAKEQAEARADMNWATFRAFCKEEGTRQMPINGPKKKGKARTRRESWNEEMLKPVSNDIAPLVKNFFPFLRNSLKIFSEKSDQVHSNVQQEMREMILFLVEAMDVFFEAFHIAKTASRLVVEEELETLKRELNNIGNKIYTNLYKKLKTREEMSYFGASMRDVYKQCILIRGLSLGSASLTAATNIFTGSGSGNNRKEYFENSVGQLGGVFAAIYKGAQKDTGAALDRFKKKLTDRIAFQTGKTHKTFNDIFGDEEINREEIKNLQKDLAKVIPESEKDLKGPLAQYLRECENYTTECEEEDDLIFSSENNLIE